MKIIYKTNHRFSYLISINSMHMIIKQMNKKMNNIIKINKFCREKNKKYIINIIKTHVRKDKISIHH